MGKIKLLVSDKSIGLPEALSEFYPVAKWQRRVVHFYRNVLHAVPKGKTKAVALMLKVILAQDDKACRPAKDDRSRGKAQVNAP